MPIARLLTMPCQFGIETYVAHMKTQTNTVRVTVKRGGQFFQVLSYQYRYH